MEAPRTCVVLSSRSPGRFLHNVPDIFSGVAELAARDAGTKAEVTDADGVIFESVGKVVIAFRHSSDEDAYALP